MVMGNAFIKMEDFIKVNGRKTICMAMDILNIQIFNT